jgi:hypothetical protein
VQLITMIEQRFFVTVMPSSRPADYYLGYMDGCVFIDFNNYEAGSVRLVRISFDGYGCCELGEKSIPLEESDSLRFKDIISKDTIVQNQLLTIVKEAIRLNRKLIWEDALEKYNLI